MFVLAVYIISFSLQALNGTATPTPRQTTHNNAKGTDKVNKQGNGNEQPSPKAQSSPVKFSGSEQSEATADQVAHHDAEQTIVIREPTPMAEKSWWDKFYVIFTGLLVAAGFSGIWYAYQTLKTIRRQSRTMTKQSILMRRSTEATEKSIRLQEVQLRQWVDVIDIQTRVNNVQGRIPEGTMQTPLFINFFITNPTGMILTLNWVIIRIDGKRQNPQFFSHPINPSTNPVRIDTSIILEGGRLESYKQHKLAISVVIYVGYTDAFNEPQKETTSCMCICGPPSGTRVYPHKGNIPDDDIQESDKDPA